MKRRSVLEALVIGAGAVSGRALGAPRKSRNTSVATPVLDSLAMPVTRGENRQYSYTDKVSGYFHGRTHTDENPDWFNGWNIATKRIFHDYRLNVDGVALSRADAQVVVSPHKMVRTYAKATETLTMLEGMAALVMQVSGVVGDQIGFKLQGNITDTGMLGPEGVYYAPKEATGSVLLVAPLIATPLQHDPVSGTTVRASAAGFLCVHAATKPEALRILTRVRRGNVAMIAARAQRMEGLVSGNLALDAGDVDRTKALLWMRLTADQLVMKQMGTGIYAGLPWFNDYWGRDTFISITGTLFVTGQYALAAEVFESFAALQDVDPKSKTYGRVPNRARPDGIEYNSADGTPRFIITLADLVARSGDVALAKRLWPAVKRAVEGVLANNVDELGLITHDDADTWMDAKEKGVRAWSPRGNRAVDVQALWVEAFGGALALQYPAEAFVGYAAVDLDMTWRRSITAARDKLSASLNLFREPRTDFLVDHLRPDGSQDLSVRPNVLFALSMPVPFGAPEYDPDPSWASIERDMIQIRDLWKALVYSWGVATLSQDDPNFYPYHEHWHYYHKDAAYHNGTVWPWLNGIAIQRLVEFNQIVPAWQLFENMNRQALREGAVGSLAECADALPVESAPWARRTGTFLQAWSNAEHLRVWQECFLGIRPTLNYVVSIRPRLPIAVSDVRITVPVAKGNLDACYHIRGEQRWRFTWRGPEDVLLDFDAPDVMTVSLLWSLKSDQTIEYWVLDGMLNAKVIDLKAETVEHVPASFIGAQTRGIYFPLEDQKRVARQRRALELRVFANLDFCKPRLQPNLKSLSVRHDPPLTY